MENVVITTMAFEPLANGERAFFRLRKIVGEEDSSTEHDRLRRRAATNEDALERVACAALSVYPHYQVWSASGGKCGAHSRAFLFSDWCIAVATWPAIGRLHTTNSRGVHYPWGTHYTYVGSTRATLNLTQTIFCEDTTYTWIYIYIYTYVYVYNTHTCMYGCYLREVCAHIEAIDISLCVVYIGRFHTPALRYDRMMVEQELATSRAETRYLCCRWEENRRIETAFIPTAFGFHVTGPKDHCSSVYIFLEYEHGDGFQPTLLAAMRKTMINMLA